MIIINRRLNPQGKSLDNRQRFMRRAKEQIKKAVEEAASKRDIKDLNASGSVKVSRNGLREPSFSKSRSGGIRDHVVPGIKEFMPGDEISRPQGGGGGRGSKAGEDGEGQDEFEFVLSREEFMDMFLEDLELPDLVKQKIAQSESHTLHRAGHASSGNPTNLNLVRTMRNGMARRIALKRPKSDEIEAIQRLITEMEEAVSRGDGKIEDLQDLREQAERLIARARLVPYLDPVDVRYNRFEKVPQPVTQAVMFCLMDVSGSMTETMKDLAKRFFTLLYLFLRRKYKKIEIVFIRHTHVAEEVDEQTFFYGRETGGTVVSCALEEMDRIIAERFPAADWNIYGAQASDGDNLSSDNAKLNSVLTGRIIGKCQYFAYVEICPAYGGLQSGETDVWKTYAQAVSPKVPFAMKKVQKKSDIFPVFRELFSRDQ